MTKPKREVLLKEDEIIVSRVPDDLLENWLQDLEQSVQLKVFKRYGNYLEFDLMGCDTSFANALRRIMTAEVPTMAIETVFVMNNTSVVQDEVLSHRLGLIPIYADARKFEYLPQGGEPTDVNTLVFELHARCSLNPEFNADMAAQEQQEKIHSLSASKRFVNGSVYSGQLTWIPQGSQKEIFAADPVRPCHADILLAKMRPGQEIDLEVHCVKGVGKEHAKWAPVSCCTYRLMPKISISAPIEGAEAHKFAKCFAPGVVKVVTDASTGNETAVVVEPRYDTVSRECLRHPEFKEKVVLSRVADHFIFQIETVGFLQPHEVVVEAIKTLQEKCARLQASLSSL